MKEGARSSAAAMCSVPTTRMRAHQRQIVRPMKMATGTSSL
jgi:hypothetical protein